jgi:hypothetical protein
VWRGPLRFKISHRLLAHRALQHLRQLSTFRLAGIVHAACDFLRTFGGQFIQPINDLGIAATSLDETIETVTTVAPALAATDAQNIKPADKITEYDCAVAGHLLLKSERLRANKSLHCTTLTW